MKVLLSGGCKNGKSTIAQHMAMSQGGATRYYLATMRPTDKEDENRIHAHQEQRKEWGFTTIECPENLEQHTQSLDHQASFLLDSTTALLANEMFLKGNQLNMVAHEKIIQQLTVLLSKTPHMVIVSDYIFGEYMGKMDPLSLVYVKSLAAIDAALAKLCDQVIEVCYGNMIYHKGG